MHGRRAKLLVPVSGTRNFGGELGSCAMGLSFTSGSIAKARRSRILEIVPGRCKKTAYAEVLKIRYSENVWHNNIAGELTENA